ncbi:unnamed protein product [Triticum turgidum subsp. durum]|uniref:Uncharacterized protein n=1 Tax=Triticum turgidum subsp. durum TaxID=4567 RepID=A0A9R1Q815_TRITD|nr:unnamed protein product [Triticum turgidum subsp. durum]
MASSTHASTPRGGSCCPRVTAFTLLTLPFLSDSSYVLDSADGLLLLQRKSQVTSAIRVIHTFTGDFVEQPLLMSLIDPPRLDHHALSSYLLPPRLIATCPTGKISGMFYMEECVSEILVIGHDANPLFKGHMLV